MRIVAAPALEMAGKTIVAIAPTARASAGWPIPATVPLPFLARRTPWLRPAHPEAGPALTAAELTSFISLHGHLGILQLSKVFPLLQFPLDCQLSRPSTRWH